MIPVVTGVRLSGARHRAELPLLVLGPSLGTSAGALWTDCAHGLTDHFDVLDGQPKDTSPGPTRA